jgi:hypothetical protein
MAMMKLPTKRADLWQINAWLVAPLLLMATAAHGQTPVPDKLCIFAAAQKLPAIPGIVIVASRVIQAQLGPKATPESSTRMVEIDTKAAAQDATFQFICVSNDKVTLATPVGVTR